MEIGYHSFTIDKKIVEARVVTLVGSMKFWDKFVEVGAELHQKGEIVFLPFKSPDYINGDITESQKEVYNDLVRAMIRMSDYVMVIDVDGYIGKSTSSEIRFAENNHVPVTYYSEINQTTTHVKTYTLCGSRKFIKDINYVYRTLSTRGYVVFTPAIFDHGSFDGYSEDRLNEVLANFDIIHHQKIRISDAIIVVDPYGYIGDDTKDEIIYAREHGIDIIFTETPSDPTYITGGYKILNLADPTDPIIRKGDDMDAND